MKDFTSFVLIFFAESEKNNYSSNHSAIWLAVFVQAKSEELNMSDFLKSMVSESEMSVRISSFYSQTLSLRQKY